MSDEYRELREKTEYREENDRHSVNMSFDPSKTEETIHTALYYDNSNTFNITHTAPTKDNGPVQ